MEQATPVAFQGWDRDDPPRDGRPLSFNTPTASYYLLEKMFAGSITGLHKARVTNRQGSEELVAVKKLLPHLARDRQLVTSFVDEARLATRLEHQNVIRTPDFGRRSGARRKADPGYVVLWVCAVAGPRPSFTSPQN